MPAGGTADAVLYFPETRTMEVVDLKGGKGIIVEVEGNTQTRVYALGAVLACAGLPVATIKSTIIQPRAPHKDGRIRSEEITVMEAIDWASDLMQAVNDAKTAFATSTPWLPRTASCSTTGRSSGCIPATTASTARRPAAARSSGRKRSTWPASGSRTASRD